MSVSEALATHVDEIMRPMELAPRVNGFHLEPRCRICRNDQIRVRVNNLLATGASYAMILRTLKDDNAELAKCDQATIDSIRNHCQRHFPVQHVAHATYREILERRAEENRVDFVEAVTTALTPLAFFEVVMAKAFRALVDDRTEVSVDTGLRAAEKLQSFLDKRDRFDDILQMRLQVHQILDAVKSTVPEEMWGAIADKLDGPNPSAYALHDDIDDDDEVFDPGDCDEIDDEF